MNILKIPIELWFTLIMVGLSYFLIEKRTELDRQEAERNRALDGAIGLITIDDDIVDLEQWNACLLPDFTLQMDIRPVEHGTVSKLVCTDRKEHIEYFTKFAKFSIMTCQTSGCDSLIGADFGILYQVAVVKYGNGYLFLVNPRIVHVPEWDQENHWCEYTLPDGSPMRRMGVPRKLKIASKNIETRFASTTEHTFEDEEACIVWVTLEMLRGK